MIEERALMPHDIAFISSGTLGSMGSLVLIGFFMASKAIRTPLRSIVFVLSVADLMYALSMSFYIGVYSYAALPCYVRKCVLIFFSLSSFSWTTVFAHHLVNVLHSMSNDPPSRTCVLAYAAAGVLFPLAGVLAYFLGSSGATFTTAAPPDDEPWFDCVRWRDGTTLHAFVIAVGYAAPLVVNWLLSMYYFGCALRYAALASEFIDLKLKQMMLLPMAFVLLRFWGVVHLFCLASGQRIWWVLLARGIGDGLQGFVNALVFLPLDFQSLGALSGRQPLLSV
jgi:hypothetical protein